MIALLILTAFALGAASITAFLAGRKVGTSHSWESGRRYGRDEQFADNFIAAGKRERARRDRQGKFKQCRH